MPNYGAYHSAKSDINTIRNLLMQTQPKDQSLFFLLKELIQNGDDCGSTKISIGWSKGLRNAKHPLLKGPAIIVVNDGSFNEKDEKSIRSIGASAKESDSAAVGKFGIGLKTVFLICETFFYLTGPNAKSEKPDKKIESGSMLNLWYTDDPDDVPPSEWDKLEFEISDQNRISEEREKLGFEDGFLLWLPLRKEEHCKRGGEICRQIAPNFIGDQKSYADEFNETLINNIATLFPLLKNIQTIQVSDGQESNIIRLTPESVQSFKDFKKQQIQPKTLKGEIAVNDKLQEYFGYQQLLNNTELTNLKDQEDWPTLVPNASGHQEKQKAEQHCASVLLARPKESKQGTLLIRWAVFLPTTECPKGGDFERIPIKGNEDYILTLHGFFFLESDRSCILDWSTSNSKDLLKLEWNRILAEQGTLPLLLPTIADFAQTRSSEIVKELTENLKSSHFWHDYKEFICANRSLVYVVRFDRRSESCWQLVEAETNIYSIPESESLIQVLPRLKKISQDCILTYESWPILSQQEPQRLPAYEVANLLGQSYGSASKICADSEKVETLLSFLKFTESTSDTQVTKTLQGFLKQAFSSTDSKLAPNLSKLLKIIPSTDILYIPEDFTKDLSLGLLEIQSEVTCLIVPSSFKLDNFIETNLSKIDAQKILERISQFSHNHISLVESFALDILRFSSNEFNRILESIKQLPLFQLKPIAQASKNQVASLNQLQTYLDRKCLFSQKGQLAIALNKALHTSLYTANSKISHYLAKNITICNLESAIALLVEKPRLQPISERKDLIIELLRNLDNDISTKQKQVIRYLLHGESNHFSDENRLFYAGEERDNDLWYRVLHHLIGTDQQWRFISSELLNIFNPQQRKNFNIAKVNQESIQKELKQRFYISRIDWSNFSTEDREELIFYLEDKLVKQLRIHKTTKGTLVALDEHTYLEGGFEIEASLAQKLGITLICKSENGQVAHRQGELIPHLTPEDALKRILALPNPEQHWRVIMEALEANPSECSQISNIKTTAWLPLQNDESCKPEDVLYIPKLEEHLVRLSAECDGAFIASNDLLPALQEHSAFSSLHQKVFPKVKDALEMLGAMLLDNPEYCVGNVKIGDTNQSITLEIWLTAFESISEGIMPAVSLLQPLSDSDYAQILYQALQGELDSEKLVNILNELSGQHKNKTNRRNIYLVYSEYLKLAVEHDDWFEIILPQIELLNQLGEWKPSKELCCKGTNVNDHYLLDEALEEILESVIERAGAIQDEDIGDSEFKESHDFLKDYFSEWPNSVSNAISAFLSCLGNNDKIRDLASSYAPNAESFPSQLIINENNPPIPFSDFLVEHKTNFEFKESTETSITVNNLLGQPLTVELEDLSEAKSLLVGSPNITSDSVIIYLHDSSQNESPKKLIDFLYYTTLEILESVYEIKPNNFDSLWKDWQEASPPDIRLTQNLLLEEAMIYLRQNQLSEDNKIARLIRKRFEFRTRQAEKQLLEEEGKPIPKDLSASINQDEKSLKAELRQLLEEDSETHKILSEGVRKRIQDANYDIASIPFEIFQNADDACSELSQMGCSNVSRRIKIVIEKETLYFIHWGRGINQARFGSNDYRNKKYDEDLQKMLLLNFSDKKEGVTGKFGLGFKSVYLISDNPRVVSDRLGFEVNGGLYPKELSKDEFNAIAQYREGDEGTVIKLPLYLPLLDQGAAEVYNQIEQFKSYIPLLGAFSRWLREFVINLKKNERQYEWREKDIIPKSKVAIGELIPKSNNFQRALLLGTNEERFVFPLGLRGIEPLYDHYPTFWVTAPTRMKLNMGFAVNAMFRLDVGRSQLDLRGGGKKENYAIAQRLGNYLSEALRAISQFDDQKLREHLHLTADTTRLMFWESVWKVLGLNIAEKNLEAEEIKLLHEMLWGKNGGMTQLYRDCHVLPTGLQLPNHFEEGYRLTCLNKVRWFVKGVLEESSVLETVFSWKSCQGINAGELISSSVAKSLKRLTSLEIESLDLPTILQWELREKLELTAEMATKIGELINPELIANLEETEKDQLLKVLNKVKFQPEEGNWSCASSLLILEGNTDESQIAKFAPNACLLNQSYQSTALDLFHVCRQDKSISLDHQIIKWIQQAEEKKRDAALMYLIDGKRRDEVIGKLKSQITNWIQELTYPTRQEQLVDRGFRKYRLKNLLDRLGLLSDKSVESSDSKTSEEEEETSNDDNELSSQKKKTQKTPEELLNRLLQWWEKERNHLIPKYEESIYPSQEWKLTLANYNLQKSQTTKAWIALFLLGVFHTMGRQTPEQHRTFLKHCEQWRWFQVMEYKKIKATDWLNLLKEYFSDIKTGERLDYYQWVRHYPAVYAFSRWWDVYRDSLLFTNEVRKNCDINMVFSPRSNNQFLQGSGKGNDAPPIGRILGIGQTFVVRELLRAKILTNPAMRPYAYVPVRRVRGILQALGCKGIREGGEDRNIENSRSIHSFLFEHLGEEDATFCGDYDLPFLMFDQEDENRKEEILGDVPIISEPSLKDDVEVQWAIEDGEWRTRWDGVKFKVKK